MGTIVKGKLTVDEFRKLEKDAIMRHEEVDGTPLAPPIGYKRQPSIFDHVRELVAGESLRQAAMRAGAETFEEADDFEIGDDYDPSSPYEMQHEGLSIAELRDRLAQAEAAEAAAKTKDVPAGAAPQPKEGAAPGGAKVPAGERSTEADAAD